MEIAHERNTEKMYSELCKVLGIDTDHVNKVTIVMEAGELFTVTIKKYLITDNIRNFVEEVKKYNLKEAHE